MIFIIAEFIIFFKFSVIVYYFRANDREKNLDRDNDRDHDFCECPYLISRRKEFRVKSLVRKRKKSDSQF